MDASDRRSIRAAERAARLADRNRGEVLVALAGTQPGRRWLWERLEAAHIFSSVYHDLPVRMAFLEGERNQGLKLLDDLLRWCPDQFILMMREANARRSEQDLRDDQPGFFERTSGERSIGSEPGRDDQGPGSDDDLDGSIRDIEDLYADAGARN